MRRLLTWVGCMLGTTLVACQASEPLATALEPVQWVCSHDTEAMPVEHARVLDPSEVEIDWPSWACAWQTGMAATARVKVYFDAQGRTDFVPPVDRTSIVRLWFVGDEEPDCQAEPERFAWPTHDPAAADGSRMAEGQAPSRAICGDSICCRGELCGQYIFEGDGESLRRQVLSMYRGCEGAACAMSSAARPALCDTWGPRNCLAGDTWQCPPNGDLTLCTPARTCGDDGRWTDCGYADVQVDAENCGACGTRCTARGDNGIPSCEMGVCVERCAPGWIDDDDVLGCETECVRVNDDGRDDTCDQRDDDCDGAVDEDVDLDEDIDHCGGCDRRCAPPHATPLCVEGMCAIEQCTDRFHDVDGQPGTGCEYGPCDPSDEVCNGQDDDCNGAVDEDFDLTGDVSHCGACDSACAFDHALPVCTASACGFTSCEPGYHDLDEQVANGCEYGPCVPDGPERCDEVDNDCDGQGDEGFDLTVDLSNCGACGTVCEYSNGTPECTEGACRGACDPGYHDVDGQLGNGCEYACEPTGDETCNGLDDDCDNRVDEAFDTLTDTENCGGCRNRCTFLHAGAVCVEGACALGACDADYRNANGESGDGCECRVRAEECNGSDDDCDGHPDEDFDITTDVDHCGACGERCRFDHGIPACVDGVCGLAGCRLGWIDVDGDPENGCEVMCRTPLGRRGAEICDEFDNDCDGQIDEIGDACMRYGELSNQWFCAKCVDPGQCGAHWEHTGLRDRAHARAACREYFGLEPEE